MSTETAMPQNKSDLLARIEREWTALQALIAPLTEQQLTDCAPGEWAIKDHLAHIAAWEEFLLANQFQGRSPLEVLAFRPEVIERHDENEMNALFWERGRARPAADLLAASRDTHAALVQALALATESDLQTPTRSIGPQVQTRLTWTVWNTYEHYEEHRRTIQAKVMA